MTPDPTDNDASYVDRARRLRREATLPEKLLWGQLRTKRVGAKFRRQHIFGPYYLDFYCHEVRLAIELDGGQHFAVENEKRDAQRTRWLESQGLTVLRFTNTQVLHEMTAVVDRIIEAIDQRRTRGTPSP